VQEQPDIVIIHRGGLGDFLMAWPAMHGICEHFSKSDRFWIGPLNRLPWLKPLGLQICPREMQLAFDALFASRSRLQALAGTKIFWFVLEKHPPVEKHPNLFFLQGLHHSAMVPVRQMYAKELLRQGIFFDPGWLAAWRTHFGKGARANCAQTNGPRKTALLFPGAGHSAKQWPLVQFFELAGWLEKQGVTVRFVLGPAEVEQGMRICDFPVERPQCPGDLTDLLRGADMVAGNDSGPMHLAGMSGVPGVVLFGPASKRQWAPVGLRAVGSDTPCRPCTANGRIHCDDPRCMAAIGQDVVRRELAALLGKQ